MKKCRDCKEPAAEGKSRCEKHLEHYREYARANMARIRDKTLQRQFGITLEEYRAMNEAQQGLCAICKQPERVHDPNKAKRGLAVDHNHTTGKVRALLCNMCNTALGGFGDDISILQAAIDYLEHFAY